MMLTLLLQAYYATIIAVVLAFSFGSLGFGIALFSLLAGWFFSRRHAAALLASHPEWRFWRFHDGESGNIEILFAVFILYIACRHFLWLLYPVDHHLNTLSATNYGDLPMHVNFIRAFANGVSFPPKNPIFASELLRYPYGADLYNALWDAVGVRLEAHLFVVGIVGTAISIALLRAFGGWYAIGGFFLSGGLAGWKVLSGAPLQDFQGTVAWKNLFLSVFVTQRGMLFALPIGLLLLLAWRGHVEGTARLSRRQMRILGLIWGFLPLFHLHAFLAISLMLFAITVEYGGGSRFRERRTFSSTLKFFISPMARWAYLPAFILIYHSTKGFQAGSVAKWQPGWTGNGRDLAGFWDYLIQNFGPWMLIPPLIAMSILISKDQFTPERRRQIWIEFGAYCALFLLFFNLMLAPWDWDNIKLLIWPYLGFTRLMWIVIEPHMGSVLGFVERPFVAFTLFLSGFVVIAFTLRSPMGKSLTIYNDGELANVEGALANVPANAVFSATQSPQHPLTYFGRLRVAGYAGHIWSHNIDGNVVTQKLEQLMKGEGDAAQLARELGVTHIFWGPDERAVFGAKHHPFMDAYENVSRVPGYEIYAVK